MSEGPLVNTLGVDLIDGLAALRLREGAAV